VFTGGQSFAVFPLKVFFMALPAETGQLVQAGVGVSARNFRKAVDRNRIKRLLREAYRLNKTVFTEGLAIKEKQLAVFFLYTGKELPELVLLNEKMRKALDKLAQTVNK
jgi:ribonuclease P protein component